jgi:hypothetical protein
MTAIGVVFVRDSTRIKLIVILFAIAEPLIKYPCANAVLQ